MTGEPNPCIVPGCRGVGRNVLGVRCRVWHHDKAPRGKTYSEALWAPNSTAFLCDEHALGGATISVLFEANESRQNVVNIIASGSWSRRTEIKQ